MSTTQIDLFKNISEGIKAEDRRKFMGGSYFHVWFFPLFFTQCLFYLFNFFPYSMKVMQNWEKIVHEILVRVVAYRLSLDTDQICCPTA